MNNNRIYLVTGAAGFLGSNICLQLLEQGCRVRALVLNGNKSARFIPEDVEIVFGDLTDAASLEPFFTIPEGMTSVVIHCASMVTVDPSYSEKLMAVNVGGTRNIITKCLAHRWSMSAPPVPSPSSPTVLASARWITSTPATPPR